MSSLPPKLPTKKPPSFTSSSQCRTNLMGIESEVQSTLLAFINDMAEFLVSHVLFFGQVEADHIVPSGTVEYDLSKNHSTEAAFSQAEKDLQMARQKIKNMSSLSLPTGKTKQDMELRNTSSPPGSLESAAPTTKGNTDDEPIDKSKLEILPVPSRPAVFVKWKEPDGHILKMRAMAKQSGKKYTQRLAGVKGRKPVVYRDRL
jgi:hypothetical protein